MATRFLGSLLDGAVALWARSYRRRNHTGRLRSGEQWTAPRSRTSRDGRHRAHLPDDTTPSPTRRSAVTDSDLMFRPATELAGMVRSGEISSRELVETSLARIGELNPQLNAFVQVDGERALAVAEEIKSGDERPFE